MSMYDLGLGVLCFNPFDDKEHLERINICLRSLLGTIHHAQRNIKLIVLLNQSVVGRPDIPGVGPKTKQCVYQLLAASDVDYCIKERKAPNSNVRHYHTLQQHLHAREHCQKIVVFADDYIVPTNWIQTVLTEFSRYPKAGYLTPATVFVPQEQLLVPLTLKPHWDVAKQPNGRIVGIKRGVSINDVNAIAYSLRRERTLRQKMGQSFETTVFTRRFLDKYGYVDPHYFFIHYNNEYFFKAHTSGGRGIISRRAFVFHHGKGGTSSYYKKTRDEKYESSPVEALLVRDIRRFNKKNNTNIPSYSWNPASRRDERPISFAAWNRQIQRIMQTNNKAEEVYLNAMKQILKRIVKKVLSPFYRP